MSDPVSAMRTTDPIRLRAGQPHHAGGLTTIIAALGPPLVPIAIVLVSGETALLGQVSLWSLVVGGPWSILLALMWRRDAWLDGTIVHVRFVRTRRADLTTADVRLDSVSGRSGRPVIPVLRARNAGAPSMAVVLRKGVDGPLLPAERLNALAEAISAGARPEPEREEAARQVADHLRRLSGTHAPSPVERL